MLRNAARLIWIVALLACSDVLNPNCTDRGCTEGLFLTLSGDLLDTFIVRLITVSTAPWDVECTPATCDGRLEFEGFLPQRLSVEVEAAGEVIYWDHFEPTYETVYPNGPDCDGKCLQTTLEIEL